MLGLCALLADEEAFPGEDILYLLGRVLAVVVIVVVLYWAVYLPNPSGLKRDEAIQRMLVRVLAVVVMAILAMYLALHSLDN